MTNPPILDHGFLTHYPHNNDDLTVVNAARVSMGKRVDKILLAGTPEAKAREDATGIRPDDSLINYLAQNRHWTPFGQVRFRFYSEVADLSDFFDWAGSEERRAGFLWSKIKWGMCDVEGSLWGWLTSPPPIENLEGTLAAIAKRCPLSSGAILSQRPAVLGMEDIESKVCARDLLPDAITLHIRWPIFVARQAMRHNVGIDWNEVSRRYVTDEPVLHKPSVWRRKAKSVKQGSTDEPVEYATYRHPLTGPTTITIAPVVEMLSDSSESIYHTLVDSEVCPEQARMILPQSLYTECIATFTRPALARFIRQRIKKDAQWEIRQYAQRALAVGVGVFGGEFEKECESQ